MTQPDNTIVINGETVPKVIKHSDGSQTWNLDAKTAEAIGEAMVHRVADLMARMLK
jgi:hypothetical protein